MFVFCKTRPFIVLQLKPSGDESVEFRQINGPHRFQIKPPPLIPLYRFITKAFDHSQWFHLKAFKPPQLHQQGAHTSSGFNQPVNFISYDVLPFLHVMYVIVVWQFQ